MALTVEEYGESATVTVVRQTTEVNENEQTTQFVEVFRSEVQPINLTKDTQTIERVYPIGSLVNVGVGPELPEHPYEGQVWIKI